MTEYFGQTDKFDSGAEPDQLNRVDLVNVLKSAADTLRLDILCAMRRDSFGVQELASIFDMQQPGMSHHLKILFKSGLVTSRREGNSLFYRRSLVQKSNPLRFLMKSIFGSVDQIKLDPSVVERIKKIHESRGRASKEFFSKNATKFVEHQGQIATYNQYSTAVEDLLAKIIPSTFESAMEIGPGEGELLLHLAQKFKKIYGLDNTKEMLVKSENRLLENEIHHGNFIFGEPETAIAENIKVDLLVLNMVLHHLPAPAEMFATAEKLLTGNGELLLIELCPHDQDWVKESCGDIWLGFEPEELNDWASESGLRAGQEMFLGLKNGFQIQMKVFFKD